jgi:hypothetical protein
MVAPLAAGRFVLAVGFRSDVVAFAGAPATGFGPPVVVASGELPGPLSVAGGGPEAVVAWAPRAADPTAIRAALYDDRATQQVALSEVTLTRRRFARPITIRWQVSVPATMTFGVARLRGKRAVKVGSFARPAHPGVNQLRFAGVLHGHRLRPGRYRLTAVATAPGMAPSAPVSVTFVVRRLSRGRG